MKRLILSLAFLAVFVTVASSPKVSYAIENPSSYYDWNTYVPTKEVLGLEAKAQEEATSSSEASPVPTFATQPTSTDYRDYREHDYVLGFASSWIPSDPFYFVKRIEEGVTIAFTFNSQAQQELRIEYAGERLHEMQTAIEEGKTQVVDNLARSYQDQINAITNNLQRMSDAGGDVTKLADLVDIESSKHNLVLEEIAIQSPEEVAGEVDEAIIATENAVDTVADVEDKPAVPESVVDRLQAQKALGVLTGEEVQKVIDSDSRREAREELRSYVNENLFPESDYKRFDETAMENFPNGYYKVLEIKKFEELKRLETDRPDDVTLAKVQEFAKTYKPGEIVPSDIRRWWVPMVRLEELQNTIRPDLISSDYFRNRPDYYQKYQEVVERVKPRQEDVDYVNNLVSRNPNLLNDPAYARIKALADKFGAGRPGPEFSTDASSDARGASCGGGSHWVYIPYMPGGGYCVPNYEFPTQGQRVSDSPCPSGYHRNYVGSACYPDNPTSGIYLPAAGSCYAGYRWISDRSSPRGGYCSPETVTDGNGFPNPIYTVGYCLPGQMFRDGKCETYNPPPNEGCTQGSWWNGTSCIQMKNCDSGYYQDYTGECKKTSETQICASPPTGCGFNAYWDGNACSCKSTIPWEQSGGGGTTSCSEPTGGCPNGGTWDRGTCTCKPAGGCPSGTAWNGSYCMQNSAPYSGSGSSSYTPYPYYNSGGGSSSSCQPPSAGCPGGWWDYGSCSCRTSSTTSYPTSAPSSSGTGSTSCGPGYTWTGSYCTMSGSSNCGSGYYWNGSYCAPSSSTSTSSAPAPTMTESQPTSVSTPTETQSAPPPTETQSAPPPAETTTTTTP